LIQVLYSFAKETANYPFITHRNLPQTPKTVFNAYIARIYNCS